MVDAYGMFHDRSQRHDPGPFHPSATDDIERTAGASPTVDPGPCSPLASGSPRAPPQEAPSVARPPPVPHVPTRPRGPRRTGAGPREAEAPLPRVRHRTRPPPRRTRPARHHHDASPAHVRAAHRDAAAPPHVRAAHPDAAPAPTRAAQPGDRPGPGGAAHHGTAPADRGRPAGAREEDGTPAAGAGRVAHRTPRTPVGRSGTRPAPRTPTPRRGPRPTSWLPSGSTGLSRFRTRGAAARRAPAGGAGGHGTGRSADGEGATRADGTSGTGGGASDAGDEAIHTLLWTAATERPVRRSSRWWPGSTRRARCPGPLTRRCAPPPSPGLSTRCGSWSPCSPSRVTTCARRRRRCVRGRGQAHRGRRGAGEHHRHRREPLALHRRWRAGAHGRAGAGGAGAARTGRRAGPLGLREAPARAHPVDESRRRTVPRVRATAVRAPPRRCGRWCGGRGGRTGGLRPRPSARGGRRAAFGGSSATSAFLLTVLCLACAAWLVGRNTFMAWTAARRSAPVCWSSTCWRGSPRRPARRQSQRSVRVATGLALLSGVVVVGLAGSVLMRGVRRPESQGAT